VALRNFHFMGSNQRHVAPVLTRQANDPWGPALVAQTPFNL
jgi:hypothetical protein